MQMSYGDDILGDNSRASVPRMNLGQVEALAHDDWSKTRNDSYLQPPEPQMQQHFGNSLLQCNFMPDAMIQAHILPISFAGFENLLTPPDCTSPFYSHSPVIASTSNSSYFDNNHNSIYNNSNIPNDLAQLLCLTFQASPPQSPTNATSLLNTWLEFSTPYLCRQHQSLQQETPLISTLGGIDFFLDNQFLLATHLPTCRDRSNGPPPSPIWPGCGVVEQKQKDTNQEQDKPNFKIPRREVTATTPKLEVINSADTDTEIPTVITSTSEKRFRFSRDQSAILKKIYKKGPKPEYDLLQELAGRFGVERHRVKIW
ncbi:UNVERIFIED_CONTAM: hypothetical protein HDU68_007745 [Siphonaria sp. JEL0065]|nr:hypothetical protein HDU68_007745 [Siphonaria sp. JEL0065]